jgi:L-gulonate 5-dehydrogenase
MWRIGKIMRQELTLAGLRPNRRLNPRIVEWLAEGKLTPASITTKTSHARDARPVFELIESSLRQS